MGYIIIPNPKFSNRQGTKSRCRRFDLLLVAVLTQFFIVMTAVVAVQVFDVSLVIKWTLGFCAYFLAFASNKINLLGRTEVRTRERM